LIEINKKSGPIVLLNINNLLLYLVFAALDGGIINEKEEEEVFF